MPSCPAVHSSVDPTYSVGQSISPPSPSAGKPPQAQPESGADLGLNTPATHIRPFADWEHCSRRVLEHIASANSQI